MDDTSHNNLMEQARHLDTLCDPQFKQWCGLIRQIDHLHHHMSHVRTLGRFVADINLHGSAQAAIHKAEHELEVLTERQQEATETAANVIQSRRDLSALLNPITSRLLNRNDTLRQRQTALGWEIERARTARVEAIKTLVEAGLPRRLADRQAKPSLAAIQAMEQELAEIPDEIERNATLLSSYAGRMELHLAGTTSGEAEQAEPQAQESASPQELMRQ